LNTDNGATAAGQSESAANADASQQTVLDLDYLTAGVEEQAGERVAEELARRVAARTPLSAEVALPIVKMALAAHGNNVMKAAQQLSSQLASLTSAANRQAAIHKLAETTTQLTQTTLRTLERSSRWTLLFIGALFGCLIIAAPYALIIAKGSSAETTPEYLVTSLAGGVIVVAGLVGIIASDRGTRNAVETIHEKSVDILDQMSSMLKKN
jgi:hypothetical protein